MDSDKKIIRNVLIISIIAVALSIGIGFSFAFFTTNIKGNEDAKENLVKAARMELIFSDNTPIITNNNMNIGDTIVKEFTVENKSGSTQKYNIKLSNVINELEDKSDLVYKLVEVKDGAETPLIEEEIIPGKDDYLYNGKEINDKEIQSFKLYITFKETNDNQNDNQGKKFSGKIQIDLEEIYLVKINELNPELGSVNPLKEYVKGKTDSNNFTVTTIEDYKLGNVSCDNEQHTNIDGNSFKVTNITNNTECSVSIGKIAYTITVKSETEGMVDFDANSKEIEEGQNAIFTMTPKNGYKVSSASCDNNQTAKITGNDLVIENVTSNSICTVRTALITLNDYCSANDGLNKCISKALALEDLTNDDPGGNIRYAGADPSNYVWFNCDDYTKVTDENTAKTQNCEKWRIIGLFKDIEKADGNKENLVKIVRADSIGNYSWDNKNTFTGAESTYGKNDWTTAELMYLLNPNYSDHKLDNVLANNSLYWNSGSGNCSNAQNNVTTTCNFTSTGLKKSGPTKSMIESVKWNLGGTPNWNTETTQGFYSAERGETTYQNSRPTTWNGKVGLIYPSDYGYATAGGTNKTREDCLDYQLYSWDTGEYKTDCAGNDWLKPSSGYLWTLTPSSGSPYDVFRVSLMGFVRYYYADFDHGVRPSLYLTSKVGIKEGGGTGEAKHPYILEVME